MKKQGKTISSLEKIAKAFKDAEGKMPIQSNLIAQNSDFSKNQPKALKLTK